MNTTQANPAVIVDRILTAFETASDPYAAADLPPGFSAFALPAATPPMTLAQVKASRAKLREIIANDPAGAALSLGGLVDGIKSLFGGIF